MQANNIVQLCGRLISVSKIKGEGNRKRVNGAISVKTRKKNKETGYYENEIFNFTAWGNIADRIVTYAEVQSEILIIGSLHMNEQIISVEVIDERTGEHSIKDKKFQFVDINVEDIHFINSKNKNKISNPEERLRENLIKSDTQNESIENSTKPNDSDDVMETEGSDPNLFYPSLYDV